MTCASCVRRVERAITKVPGVESVAVNLATERATIDDYPGAASVADFRAAVERAREEGLTLGAVESFESATGRGISAVVDGHAVLLGNEALLRDWSVVPGDARRRPRDGHRAVRPAGQLLAHLRAAGVLQGLGQFQRNGAVITVPFVVEVR